MNKRISTILTTALMLFMMFAQAGTVWADEVCSWSINGSNVSITTGFTATYKAEKKTDYYQDGSNNPAYIQLESDSPLWSTLPSSINFTAKLGGGTAKDPLANNVYVCLIDNNGNEISSSTVVVTTKITATTGSDFSVSIPTAGATAAYGVKIYHAKESGYNVRYYSFSLSFETGGGGTQTLESISIQTAPTKLEYTAGENFDPAGLIINKNYINPTQTVVYAYSDHANDFSFDPSLSDALTTDDTQVTITVEGKSTTQAITVNAATGTGIISFSSTEFNGHGTSGGGESVTITKGGITIYASDGYGTSQHLRIYKNASFSITSSNHTITKINFSWESSYSGGLNQVYTPNSTSWSISSMASQARLTEIVVTYSTGGEQNLHSITVNVNPEGAGTVSPSFINVEEQGTIEVTATPNNHYHFQNWTLEGDGASLSDATANPVTVTMGTADVTLSANFTQDDQCEITFNANGGNGEMAKQTIWQGEATALNENEFTFEGYNFIGWATEQNGTVVYQDKEAVTFTQATVTLYAKWEETTDITVTYDFHTLSSYPEGFPTGGTNVAVAQSFIISGHNIIIDAPTSYYVINSSSNPALFFGKQSAYLEFPAMQGYKLTNINATTSSSCAKDVTIVIKDTESQNVSEEKTTTGGEAEYNFTITNPLKNTPYRFVITNAKNLQLYNVVLTYIKVLDNQCDNPIISAVGTPDDGIYYEYPLTINFSCETENATIHYSVNDGEWQTGNSTTITETSTVKAYATAEGYTQSAEATITFTLPIVVNDIASFKSTAEANKVYRITGDLVFVNNDPNNRYIYVQDYGKDEENTRGLQIYNYASPKVLTTTYEPGDIISGGICGTYTTSNGLTRFVPKRNTPASTQSTTISIPTVDYIDATNIELYDSRLVKFVLAEITSDQTFAKSSKSASLSTKKNDVTYIHTLFDGNYNLQGSVKKDDIVDVIGFAIPFIQGSNPIQYEIFPRDNHDIIYHSYFVTDGESVISENTTIDFDFEIDDTEDGLMIINNAILNVKGDIHNLVDNNFLIENGAQLIHNNAGVKATVYKNIDAYNPASTTTDGWNFVAAPMNGAIISECTISTTTTNATEYSLYRYDEPSHMWENYENAGHSEDFTTFEGGRGYLYANNDGTDLAFVGTLNPSNANYTVKLSKTDQAKLAGWHLIGNPFPCQATVDKSYYVINETGTSVVSGSGPISPCTGIMVKVDENAESVTFAKATVSGQANNIHEILAEVSEAISGASLMDNARIHFGTDSQLEKFFFNDNSCLYIPQGDKDFAIVNADSEGTLPVFFVAPKNGQYTLTFKVENTDMEYLHLIDNLTGTDIDLLVNDSYTFNAKTTDYPSRFKLVFKANLESDMIEGEHNFAYFSNGNLVIENEGRATLNVIDMMGRVVSSEQFSGSYNGSIKASAGIYVIQLVKGEKAMTQKIVVR